MISEIKSYLGRPFYEVPGCAIFNVDCLGAMRKIPPSFFDLTVTSPPYNIGKAYENILPLPEYLDWCEQWINEVYRITESTGAFWLNLGYMAVDNVAKAIPIPYLLWQRIPFFLMQEVVWHYGAGVACRKYLSPRNEKFLWYVKNSSNYTFNLDDIRDPNVKYPNQKKGGKLKCNPLGKNPTDVWQFKKVTSGRNRSSTERTAHPAQFPKEVIERIIKASSNEEEFVLDPFIGSGTTAEVSLSLKRNVIGFEKNKDFCQIATDRIDSYLHYVK